MFLLAIATPHLNIWRNHIVCCRKNVKNLMGKISGFQQNFQQLCAYPYGPLAAKKVLKRRCYSSDWKESWLVVFCASHPILIIQPFLLLSSLFLLNSLSDMISDFYRLTKTKQSHFTWREKTLANSKELIMF